MEEQARALYQSVLMRHYRDTTYRRVLPPPAIETQLVSRSCGDKVNLYLKLDAASFISGASYQGEGCSISIASASILCSAIVGLSISQAQELAKSIIDMLEADVEQKNLPQLVSVNPHAEEIAALNTVRQFGTRIPCAALAWKSLGSVAIL